MNLYLIFHGKTRELSIREILDSYLKRLGHYVNVQIEELPDLKGAGLSPSRQQELESIQLQKVLKDRDFIILLDENGNQWDSRDFSRQLEKWMGLTYKRIVFVVGGPYGFDTSIKEIAHTQWSLSKLTFPHQLVRVFVAEQLYRCFTLIKGEGYHH